MTDQATGPEQLGHNGDNQMSLLLAGKIETIKTNVATLISRLSSARATKLDNLDATIASRAAAATALSTAVWTGTKAGYIDQSVSSVVTALGTVGDLVPTSDICPDIDSNYRRANLGTFLALASTNRAVLGAQLIESTYGTTLTTSWADALSLTGPGVIDFLAVIRSGAASEIDINIRLMVDGVNVCEVSPGWTTAADNNSGYCLIGDMLWDASGAAPLYGGINYRPIRFATSLALQVSCATGTSVDNIITVRRSYT